MRNLDWFSTDLVLSLLIGILVLANVFLLLERVLGFPSSHARKAGGVFAGTAGVLTTIYLLEHPALLQELATELVLGLTGLVFATIALLRKKSE